MCANREYYVVLFNIQQYQYRLYLVYYSKKNKLCELNNFDQQNNSTNKNVTFDLFLNVIMTSMQHFYTPINHTDGGTFCMGTAHSKYMFIFQYQLCTKLCCVGGLLVYDVGATAVCLSGYYYLNTQHRLMTRAQSSQSILATKLSL